ncbi:helix-turn-helix domain-containing protein [Streptomyces montanisoli]|uniref:helix-turn-helix domain-containing protein n=1 Tax=Streptomyces montanisoli TaxID=2798581 RepID=UPI0027DB8A46|nr:helix-turn-helix domain-containing protein [Streptomyces montanisoli]
MKISEPHSRGFTVVGNHLAQHPHLSGLAIGLATHLQSLPDGARVDIRTLSTRLREGRVRVAAALRELEQYGYLARPRERTADGRVITRIYVYDNPTATRSKCDPTAASTRRRRPPVRRPAGPPVDPGNSAAPATPATPATPAAPVTTDTTDTTDTPSAPPEAPTEPPAEAAGPPAAVPTQLPEHAPAAALLAGLRTHDPRLMLSERDIRRLAPAVAEWLARDASPEAVRIALTAGLPSELHSPVAVLRYRLAELVPPPLPVPTPEAVRGGGPPPFQTCDACDRAFRSPEPGLCGECRPDEANEAAVSPLARAGLRGDGRPPCTPAA